MLTTTSRPRERALAVSLTRRAVLAVSGGADSMAMAAALVGTAPDMVAAIATFDHGTGPAARDAAVMVVDWATARGVPVHHGCGEGLPPREAAWRQARWAFLNGVGRQYGLPVATAHTEDDQAETVFIRLLRHSGVRGLAGLLAAGPIVRPMLGVRRADVRAFVVSEAVPFQDDPSNLDRRHLRNRVRLELLPRLELESPGFRAWLLEIGQSAAQWRRDVASATDRFWAPLVQADGSIVVARGRGRSPGVDEAALFWPEVAGRVGVALDRRGTARLASFTTKSAGGLQMPLSGGAVVSSGRAGWRLEQAGAQRREIGPTKRPAPHRE